MNEAAVVAACVVIVEVTAEQRSTNLGPGRRSWRGSHEVRHLGSQRSVIGGRMSLQARVRWATISVKWKSAVTPDRFSLPRYCGGPETAGTRDEHKSLFRLLE
ncbi:hypothetical protein J6590_030781 [Homalodisca vitripennis]|nr:hypothetical protein J6590_030781 [Homalodisca vitripennis]